jgi:hypothetical protein
MSILGEIRSLFADMFLTLPLILLGFIFFIGTLTSNVGLLYLLVGHAVLVPAISFLSDLGSNPFGDDGLSFVAGIQSLLSLSLVFWTKASAMGGGWNYLIFLLAIVPYMGQAFGGEKSVMFFYNPVGWVRSVSTNDEDPEVKTSLACAMIPNSGPARRNPSTWISHMVFLFGFVIANALAIMNEPSPALLNVKDPNYQTQENNIRTRVASRKRRSMMVIAFTTVIFVSMIGLRYKFSFCEGSFYYNLFPMIWTSFLGAAWFQILYKACGVRPADILGIVQGMISPRMADNPIVCVGD